MNDRESPWIEVLHGDWPGPLRLRVRGRSMCPTLRPGDQVTVAPVAVDALRPGDWVLLRGREGLFLHRFLGFAREGSLLTKGDAHRAADPPWPPEALLGRAVALSRRGRTVPVSSSSLRERARTTLHLLMAGAWALLRRVGLPLLGLALAPAVAWAAVTLVSFEATPEGQAIRITWETASEVDMLGFFVQRATQAEGDYQRISDLIPAVGDIVGAFYEHVDADAEMGNTCYYRLEAVEVSGATELYGPISAILPLPATETPTAAPSPTPTPMSTPSPTPTSTSTPTPTPSATATRTPASAPSPTRTPTPAPSPTRTPASAPSPTRTPAPTHSPPTATSPIASTSPTPTSTPTQSSPPTLTPTSPLTHTPTATPSPLHPHIPTPPHSPSPLLPLTPSPPVRAEPSSPPWWWMLVAAGVGMTGVGLILLGGWNLWQTRRKK